MDKSENIITLLQALTSGGGIAEAVQREIGEAKQGLASRTTVVLQVNLTAEDFVNRSVAQVASDILASGGDLSTISDAIGLAFSEGLMLGLAVGSIAIKL